MFPNEDRVEVLAHGLERGDEFAWKNWRRLSRWRRTGGAGAVGGNLFSDRQHMTDLATLSPFAARASIAAAPAFRPATDARLEQLVEFDVEEIGDPIEIFNLDFPVPVEEFVQPGLLVADPFCQRDLAFVLVPEESEDVVAKHRHGAFHREN